MELNGIICMRKPKGFTSFDVIAKMRGILKLKRLGHAGTLDPMAEGVLPVFAGRATMACDMLPDHDKVYRGGFRLGLVTDTQDITGNVTAEYAYNSVSEEKIKSVLSGFMGDIMQIPPMYSAVSVNGQRLYDLARQNITVEREPRPITVYRLELLSYDENVGEGVLEISCSKGTYIRTLINDIGEKLGTGAVMTSLTRTSACGFTLDNCIGFEELQQEADCGGDFSGFILPIEKVFEYLPEIRLTHHEERLYRNGIKLDVKRVCYQGEWGRVRIYGTEGFIGTADIDPSGVIKVGKTFVLPTNNDSYNGGVCTALGLFDGVHKGHRAVLSAARTEADRLGIRMAVFSFRTAGVTSKGLSGSCIMTEEEKTRRLREVGADYIFSPDFESMKNMSAESFVKNVLLRRMKTECVVCGEDFRFGKGAECGAEELREICGKYGISVITASAVNDENGEKISSGNIRRLISEGRVSEAARLMGGYVTVDMPVIDGNRLGRTMGVPTINQQFPKEQQQPAFGVYAAKAFIDGKIYRGIANVGVKPTVTDCGQVLCETYLFDFNEEIYGKRVRLSLIEFIRKERKFSGIDELKAQISSDIKMAEKLFAEE